MSATAWSVLGWWAREGDDADTFGLRTAAVGYVDPADAGVVCVRMPTDKTREGGAEVIDAALTDELHLMPGLRPFRPDSPVPLLVPVNLSGRVLVLPKSGPLAAASARTALVQITRGAFAALPYPFWPRARSGENDDAHWLYAGPNTLRSVLHEVSGLAARIAWEAVETTRQGGDPEAAADFLRAAAAVAHRRNVPSVLTAFDALGLPRPRAAELGAAAELGSLRDGIRPRRATSGARGRRSPR